MSPPKQCSAEAVFSWSLWDPCKLLPHCSKAERNRRHRLLL